MRWFLALLFLVGCTSTHVKIDDGIVHDYVFTHATLYCNDHGGMHYIVTRRILFENDDRDRYPCNVTYKIRCQDGTVIDFEDGVAYCFISESQLKETLEK